MFQHYGKKAFHRAIECLMDNHRTFPFARCRNVGDIEIFWHKEIDLNRTTLPRSLVGIFDMELDLRRSPGPVPARRAGCPCNVPTLWQKSVPSSHRVPDG